MFAFHMLIDIEERATQTFACNPFRRKLEGCGVRREFELEAVAQLADAFLAGSQRGTQFIEVPLALLGVRAARSQAKGDSAMDGTTVTAAIKRNNRTFILGLRDDATTSSRLEHKNFFSAV